MRTRGEVGAEAQRLGHRRRAGSTAHHPITEEEVQTSRLFAGLRGDVPGELERFLGLGFDGVFPDPSDVTIAVRNRPAAVRPAVIATGPAS